MSSEQPPIDNDNLSGNAPEPTPIPANALAEQYLLDQVQKARVDLSRSRLFGAISILVVAAYMTYITSGLQQFLRPTSAAELAGQVIHERVSEEGPQIAEQVRQQIPTLISQIPDYAMQQLPTYRANLEDQFESSLTQNLASSSDQLDKNMDTYLDAHKDEIHLALTSGQESGAVKQLGDSVTQEFLTSLKENAVGGESIQSKIDSTETALVQVRAKMDRLANGKNLTPQEKKTRHAIAIMTKTINREVPKVTAVATASNLSLPIDAAPTAP